MKRACLYCGLAVLLGPVLVMGFFYVALVYGPDLAEGTF